MTNLAKEFNLHPLIASLLEKRGLTEPEALERFLKPTSAHFRDPFLMKGMTELVALIERARQDKLSILIHGDYDADGISGSAILSKTFHKLKLEHSVFLPQRVRDGYGLSRTGVDQAVKNGAHILICLDCGISSPKEIARARSLGLKTIIIDHHRMSAEIPEADAILHPLLDGNDYPFKGFSAAGLAYKVAQALLGRDAMEYLELGALGTVADVVPLVDENRTLVRGGLKKLTDDPSLAFRELKKVAALNARKIYSSHIEYIFAPRINAAGRVGAPDAALELLMTDSREQAAELAMKLHADNRERQRIERDMVEMAVKKADIEFNWENDRVFVLWDEDWHSGVAGIVASRIVEKYKRPALVACLQKGIAKGSGRSMKGFNLYELLARHREVFEAFGGHEQAVGFTLQESRLETFRRDIQKTAIEILQGGNFSSVPKADLELSFSALDGLFLSSLERMEPFGMGNPRPVILTREVNIKTPPIRRGESLKFYGEQGGKVLEVFVPRAKELVLKAGECLDLFFSIERSFYQGEEKAILKAKEIVKNSK